MATDQLPMNGCAHGVELPPPVYGSHLAELRSSGLTDKTIRDNRIYSESDRRKLAAITNRKDWPLKLGNGLVFPITDASGAIATHRVKPERPPVRNGKPVKYLAAVGCAPRPYFPAGVREAINAGAVEVIFSEGEKKSLAATQAGFPTIGLPGVDGWHAGKSTALHSEIAIINWAGRIPFIIFDSDAADNSNVRNNVLLLAAALERVGATPKVVWLPAGPNGEKMGLDDFLVAHGSPALRKLMNEAESPEAPDPATLKQAAGEADPAHVAKRFLSTLNVADACRLRYYRSEFHYWEAGGYRALPHDDLRSKLVEYMAREFNQVHRGHVSDVLEHIRSQSLVGSHIELPAWLEPKSKSDWAPEKCVAVKNGLFHLQSYAEQRECLVPATPRFFTTANVGYSFDADAPQPVEWLRFLDSLWGDDWQSITTLREFFGYCLTSDTSLQKLLLIVGPKRSGKGTILRVLRALVGTSNVAAPTLSSLTERFGMWSLIGKQLAIVSDARLSGRADQSVITERILSITGEDAQTIDRKNLQPITLKLNTRFIIVTNELPRLGDASGALVSRMILLRTPNSFFGHEDHGLTDKLLAELPSIFLWAVSGWQSLRERGRFIQPDSALDTLAELSDLSSPISAFVREKCDVDPQLSVPVDDLYAAWKTWCEASGKTRPTDKATFGRDLSAQVSSIKRTRPHAQDGGRFYAYEGIGLKLWS